MGKSKSEIQIRWNKDQNGWTGILMPVFSIFKEKKGWTLDVISNTKKPENAHRFIPVSSVHRGKCVVTELLKQMLK